MEEREEGERRVLVVMSDSAANCVLGDKDRRRRRKKESPSWLSGFLLTDFKFLSPPRG